MIPQSYVATASNIISNAFGFAIRGAMAVAFTQYLWHLLRAHSMKVSTVELLFCLRTNPFHLFKYSAYQATPILCALAIFIWGTQVVTGFPPGALTVITSQVLRYQIVPAPTFNASFVRIECSHWTIIPKSISHWLFTDVRQMGNGSGVDAQKYSIMPIEIGEVSDEFRRGSLIPN